MVSLSCPCALCLTAHPDTLLRTDYCRRNYADRREIDEDALGTVVCSMKAYVTWTCAEILNECRERCGGQGLLSRNQVLPSLAEAHACITAEGDSNLLCQKACRDLVLQFGVAMKARGWCRAICALSCNRVRLGYVASSAPLLLAYCAGVHFVTHAALV